MSKKKTKEAEPKTPARKLSRTERKQIHEAIQRAQPQDKKRISAQDTIPYLRMFPDGICQFREDYYSKSISFQDINYQLSQPDDKAAIFDGWSSFLNFFDSSLSVQLMFLNSRG